MFIFLKVLLDHVNLAKLQLTLVQILHSVMLELKKPYQHEKWQGNERGRCISANYLATRKLNEKYPENDLHPKGLKKAKKTRKWKGMREANG